MWQVFDPARPFLTFVWVVNSLGPHRLSANATLTDKKDDLRKRASGPSGVLIVFTKWRRAKVPGDISF